MRSGTKAKSRSAAQAKLPSERARAYRERMKKKGMRLVHTWVIDTRSPEFKAEARRQARLINKSPDTEEAMQFIESHSADWDE
ncbi:MAG TPA: antitoxin MazE family protein [Xanthobacteraceae bacterium]|nr:antitoxin MazE family protein [Xanthobacteraceae bacterium]